MTEEKLVDGLRFPPWFKLRVSVERPREVSTATEEPGIRAKQPKFSMRNLAGTILLGLKLNPSFFHPLGGIRSV